MKTRYYFYLDQIRWRYDAEKGENEENIKLQGVHAIARYVLEHPEKIRIEKKEPPIKKSSGDKK